MDIKAVVIFIILRIIRLNASEAYNNSVTNTTESSLIDIYYNGLKIIKPESFCDHNICLTKCCPFGAEYLKRNTRLCINSTQIFPPIIFDTYLRPQTDNASKLFYFKTGIVQCRNVKHFQISIYASRTNQDFHLRTDGKLLVELPNFNPPWLMVNAENYCIDNFLDEKSNTSKFDALVCFPEDEEEPQNYILTATCMLISCVFIVLTVAVYIWLQKLHNVHGRVLTAYLVCLFIGFLSLATMQLLRYYKKDTKEFCLSMTVIVYFSLLSAFFWLNVMCYDIWRVFSGKREIRPQKQMIRTQMRSYSLYAFGIPSILTILLISLEYSGLPHNQWLPMIRLQNCFLSANSRLLYLYGPIFVLCIANLALFVSTAVKIVLTQRATSVLSSRESYRHDKHDKQTLFLYVKLFVLMGISWILEVISSLYPSKIWIYSDLYNAIIGLVIFIIFVCKKQILHLVKERYRNVRNLPASQNQTWSGTTTTRDETALNSSYGQ